jgi:hypothetical protein
MHSGSPEARKFDSGDGFTPAQVVDGVKANTADWKYDAITIGIPSPVLRGAVMEEPWNLGKGWVGFDWSAALGTPVRILNDAAMQALGSDEGGRMLFIGLGSRLGTALVDEARRRTRARPFSLQGQTLEDLLGQRGLVALGEERVEEGRARKRRVVARAMAAEYVVLGGGNVRLFDTLPEGIRRGSNDRAFEGGFRAWDQPEAAASPSPLEALSAYAPRNTCVISSRGTRCAPRHSSSRSAPIFPSTIRKTSSRKMR